MSFGRLFVLCIGDTAPLGTHDTSVLVVLTCIRKPLMICVNNVPEDRGLPMTDDSK